MIGNRTPAHAPQTLQSGQTRVPAEPVPGLRSRQRALRGALTPDARQAADEGIRNLLQRRVQDLLDRAPAGTLRERPLVVAGFWPIGDEPDLRPALVAWAADARLQVALPVVERRHAPLAFRRWEPESRMLNGDYGIAEPAGGALLRPDIVLVPALGFTDDAHRIGYGGGFYDRTLALLRGEAEPVLALGVAYACLHLPTGTHVAAAHDMRLDAVATEAGWVLAPA